MSLMLKIVLLVCLTELLHSASLDKSNTVRNSDAKTREAFLGIEDAEVDDDNKTSDSNNERTTQNQEGTPQSPNKIAKERRKEDSERGINNDNTLHRQKRFLEGVIYNAQNSNQGQAAEYGSKGWPDLYDDDDDVSNSYVYYYYYYDCDEDDEDCYYYYYDEESKENSIYDKKPVKKTARLKAGTRTERQNANSNSESDLLKQRRFMVDGKRAVDNEERGRRFMVDGGESKLKRAKPSTQQKQGGFLVDTAFNAHRRMFVDDQQQRRQQKQQRGRRRFLVDPHAIALTGKRARDEGISDEKQVKRDSNGLPTGSQPLSKKSEGRRMIVGDFSNAGPAKRAEAENLKLKKDKRFMIESNDNIHK